MLVLIQAFTKWGPGELTWERLRSALSQNFGSHSVHGQVLFGLSWDIQTDISLGTVAPGQFGSALRVFSWHTLQNTTFTSTRMLLFPWKCAPFPISNTVFPKEMIHPLNNKAYFSAKICIQELSDQDKQQRAINRTTTTLHKRFRTGSYLSPDGCRAFAVSSELGQCRFTPFVSRSPPSQPKAINLLYWEPVATELFHCVYVIVAEKTQVYVCKCSGGHLLCHSRLQEKKASMLRMKKLRF